MHTYELEPLINTCIGRRQISVAADIERVCRMQVKTLLGIVPGKKYDSGLKLAGVSLANLERRLAYTEQSFYLSYIPAILCFISILNS